MHAQFRGDRNKEARWFDLAATTPIVAVSVRRAANHIFHAVARGRAEILITPQAWLAARMAAVAPETTQRLASLANEFVLPAPIGAEQRRARIAEVRGIEESRTKGAPWQATAHQPVI
jgi:hypothetical protein